MVNMLCSTAHTMVRPCNIVTRFDGPNELFTGSDPKDATGEAALKTGAFRECPCGRLNFFARGPGVRSRWRDFVAPPS